MAVELRKLLCDSNPSPLLARVLSQFRLYKLHVAEIMENAPSLLNGLKHFMPGKLISTKYNVPILLLSISNKKETMAINEWVNQIFFKENVSIRDLIKSVADKEAAHSDPEFNATLKYCKEWSYNDIFCHVVGIYAISRLVYDVFELEYKKLIEK
jgi:hypothetical protein